MHVPLVARWDRTASYADDVLEQAQDVELDQEIGADDAIVLDNDEEPGEEVQEAAVDDDDSCPEPDATEESGADEQSTLDVEDNESESPLSDAAFDFDEEKEDANEDSTIADLDASDEPDESDGTVYNAEERRIDPEQEPDLANSPSADVDDDLEGEVLYAAESVEEEPTHDIDIEPSSQYLDKPPPLPSSQTTRPRRARSFGSPSVPRKFSRHPSWTTSIKKEGRSSSGTYGLLHVKRRYCPLGKKYYRCANGFTGCCSVNPCNVGSTCPDGPGDGGESQVPSVTTGRATSVGGLRSTTATRTVVVSETTAARGSSILTAFPTTAKETTSSATTASATSPTPSCPADNGKTYTDSSKIEYRIRCSSNNTFTTNSTIKVGTGGYAQCFSACSHSKSCAGFTFVGTSSGTCYLKSSMPSGSYVSETQGGATYISCEKTDPNAAAPDATDTANSSQGMSKGTKIGAIVGGVLGGILLIILILLLIACLAKRHRKKVERKRRATITHVIQGPIETQQLNPGGHLRQGSSGHDVFQPFGGFYQGWSKASPHATIIIQPPPAEERQSQTVPALRAEGGLMLPATTYRPPDRGYRQDATTLDGSSYGSKPPGYSQDQTTLDGSATARPSSQNSASRSPRFREHLDDSEGYFAASSPYNTSADSPTLGNPYKSSPSPSLANQVRRQRHLNGRNDAAQSGVSATPPKVRTPSPVSPLTMRGTVETDFAVSPLFSRHQNRF